MTERLFLTIAITLSMMLFATNGPAQSPSLRSLLKLANVKIERLYTPL